jgi:hypothetical protein
MPTSVAPSGLAFVTGDRYPGWQGSVVMGALRSQSLIGLTLDGRRMTGRSTGKERHLEALGQRIRDEHLRPCPLLGQERHSRIRAAFFRQKLTATPIDVPCVYGEK